MQKHIKIVELQLKESEQKYARISRDDLPNEAVLTQIKEQIAELMTELESLNKTIPEEWEDAHKQYAGLGKAVAKAVRDYNFTVDGAYEKIPELLAMLDNLDGLQSLSGEFDNYRAIINNESDTAFNALKEASKKLAAAAPGMSKIKSSVYKASKAMKGKSPKPENALKLIDKAQSLFKEELAWRQRASTELVPALIKYNDAIKGSIGLRLQAKLPIADAKSIALCESVHRDVSLHF